MAFDPIPTPPAKRGVKWFFHVFSQEFPSLVGLNLVCFLSFLPLVTLGPALSALGQVLGRMADDQPVEPVQEYCTLFRENLLRKLGWGLLFLAAAGVLGVSLWFYASLELLSLTGLSLAGLLCLWGVALHLLPSLSDDAPPVHPLRTAVSAALSTFSRTILSIVSALVFLIPQALFFPAFLPLTGLVGLVLPGLALAFPRLPPSPPFGD